MDTVTNNQGKNNSDGMSGGAGVLIGAVIVILALVIAIILALPYIRGRVDAMSRPVNPTINVQLPSPSLPAADTSATPTLVK